MLEPAQSRSFLRITPQGIVFCIILAFITVGSILRNVNLLIVLAGMMYATLLLNWRVSVQMLTRLSVKRIVPTRIHANQLTTINWQCQNNRERLATWNLMLEDTVAEVQADNTVSIKTMLESRVMIPQLDVESNQQVGYRVMFPRRGLYQLGKASVSNRFPFGLIRNRFSIPAERIFVGPPIGTLTPTWDRRLQSKVVGSESVERRKGFENEEFYGLREWRSGDSQRQIHWRSTARQGRLMVKEHDQRSNRDLAVVLDLWGHPSKDEQTMDEFETMLSFAATILASPLTAVEGQIAIGISGAKVRNAAETIGEEANDSDQPVNQHWTGRSLPQLARQVIPRLATASPATSDLGSTDDSSAQLAGVIKKVLQSVSTGTPVFVISTRAQTEFNRGLNDAERLANQQSGIENWVNWLRVGAAEFEQLFQDRNPDIDNQLKSVSERWVDYAPR